MGRIFSLGTVLVWGIMALVISLACLFRGSLVKQEIRAAVSAKEVLLGEPIFFSDSTLGRKELMWNFGNGDFTTEYRGSYTYPVAGVYVISLTVGEQTRTFAVRVKDEKEEVRQPVRILAPSLVLRNERVALRGDGDAETWFWMLDGKCLQSRSKQYIAQFDRVGDNRVYLITDGKDTTTTDIHVVSLGYICDLPAHDPSVRHFDFRDSQEEVRYLMQRIIDQEGNFNRQYRRILYLVRNTNVVVLLNNEIENDLASYCYGLKLFGKKEGLVIEKVIFEKEPHCVKRLLVTQRQTK